MSEQTITPEILLESILNKAESNGFKFRNDSTIDKIEFLNMGRFLVHLTIDDGERGTFEFHINELFFNHNFAKAFFGAQEVCSNCRNHLKGNDWRNGQCSQCNASLDSEDSAMERWQWDLSRLVLETDVLMTLYQYI